MITPILVPKLGMSQADITVVKWSLGDGESVEKGESVVTIETAKVTYEIEAPASGMVFALKRVKDKVKIGETLGVVAESREEFEGYKADLSQKPESGSGMMFEEMKRKRVSGFPSRMKRKRKQSLPLQS